MRRLLVLLTAIFGCNDSAGGKGLPTIADYENAAVGALCQYFQRCGEISPSQQASCQTQYTQQFTVGLQPYSINEAVSSGRIAYDSTSASSCIAAISGGGCNLAGLLSISTTGACQHIIKGLVPAGGTCKSPTECADGFCDQGTSTSLGCPGVCVAFVATGMACDGLKLRCNAGDFCSTVCTARGAIGAACTSSSQCATGLDCRSSTCQGPADEGAACTSSFTSYGCKAGLFCDTSAQPAVCKRRQPRGGLCVSTAGCNDELICVNLGGVTSPTCQNVADVGQSCVIDGCAADAACDSTSQTCKLVGQPGDDCSSGSCGLNLYCNAQQKCSTKVLYGAMCNPATNSPCLSGQCSDATMTCTLVCN